MSAFSARAGVCVMTAMLVLVGCSRQPPVPAPAAAAVKEGARTGRVVALRPVAGDPRLRADLLAAIGTAGAAATGTVAEVIVVDDDGRALSVVTTEPQALGPGARVAITEGGRLRLLAAPGG